MDNSVGKPLDRVDGRLKVTGAAKYSAEYPLEGLVHAVIVTSTIAQGTVVGVDAQAAQKAPGVLAVLSPDNPQPLAQDPSKKSKPQERFVHVFQTRKVEAQHQPVALVIADTLERATHAAALVKVSYRASKPRLDLEAERSRAYAPKSINGRQADSSTGQAPQEKPAAKVDVTYVTPYEHHNPMEPHAATAHWEDGRLTVYDATQGVFNTRDRLAALFGLAPDQVRVVTKFIGGGFGCKGSTWAHTVLAVMASRAVSRPVKLVLRREQMFGMVGFRPQTHQRLLLEARQDGSLLRVRHDVLVPTSTYDEFTEPSAAVTRMLYASGQIQTSHRLARLNIGTPTFMRAPGEASGSHALECALDELAYQLKMDPIALRLQNHADKDPETGRPFSSKSLKECYRVGAEKFGWSRRSPAPGSMKDGRTLIGWGMATATYPVRRSKAGAKATLRPDGRALVVSGSQDLGTGAYTVFTQVAADALGLPVERVTFDLGDTRFPQTPVSGGSQTSASVGSAVKLAALALRDKAIALALADPGSPLHGLEAPSVRVEDGQLVSGGKKDSYAALMKRQKLDVLEADADAAPGAEKDQYAMHSFGAQFAEVRVDPDLREVRVSRWVGTFGAGAILNAKTARSQMYGGIVMGIGMALMEHSVLDGRTGRFVTQDLADYHVPVNPDVPDIDITFVDERDEHVNELGVKGIGEIGITGVSAAIVNAVFHATGRRVRELPLTLDRLLDEA